MGRLDIFDTEKKRFVTWIESTGWSVQFSTLPVTKPKSVLRYRAELEANKEKPCHAINNVTYVTPRLRWRHPLFRQKLPCGPDSSCQTHAIRGVTVVYCHGELFRLNTFQSCSSGSRVAAASFGIGCGWNGSWSLQEPITNYRSDVMMTLKPKWSPFRSPPDTSGSSTTPQRGYEWIERRRDPACLAVF